MTTALLRLRDSPEVDRVVELLAPHRHLHLRLEEPARPPPGSCRGVAALDLWTEVLDDLPGDIDAALANWCETGVEFEITDVASFGADRLVEEIFFPLFVRHLYFRQQSDFPMNAQTFRRLATPDLLVTTARVDDQLVAAALFQPARRSPSHGASDRDLVAAGMDVVAAATQTEATSDPFFFASLHMLAAHDISAVRVRRTPWATVTNGQSWRRDVQRAHRVTYGRDRVVDYFWWQPAALEPDEGVVTVEWRDGALRTRHLGAMSDDLARVRTHLDRFLADPNKPR
ncbi:MAG: hypothetical protein AAGC55_08515 [Myxococcota bacterium]